MPKLSLPKRVFIHFNAKGWMGEEGIKPCIQFLEQTEGLMSALQPLDVILNKSFKDHETAMELMINQ